MESSSTVNGNWAVTEKPQTPVTYQQPSYIRIIPLWLRDAIELCVSMRGLGWDFGIGIYIPNHTRPLDRRPFVIATLRSFIRNFLVLDFLEWLLKMFPGVGDPRGGSIFYPQLPPLQRYAVSTTIHIISGSCLLAGFGMCYDLLTLVGVVFFHGSPNNWPPIMDNPWSSDSLHEFWAMRWHQIFRRAFTFFGGYPGRLVGGNTGAVFGTFITSGLYHECAMYGMGRGFDYRTPMFFAIQGPLLIMERYWRMTTGRRVGGWPGRLWVYFVILVLGQPMCKWIVLFTTLFVKKSLQWTVGILEDLEVGWSFHPSSVQYGWLYSPLFQKSWSARSIDIEGHLFLFPT
jgi:Membrane bound O-acyl transferase family